MMYDVSFETLRRAEQLGKHETRLGLYLKLLRNDSRKTLREVSEESKSHGEPISTSMLADAEKGSVIPSAAKLVTLSKIFQVSPQRFLDLIDLDHQGKFSESSKPLQFHEKAAEESFKVGDYSTAHAHLENALCRPLDETQQAVLRNRKAICLWKLGKLNWARDEFEYVLSIRSLDDEMKWRAYTNLSSVFRQMGNMEMSQTMAHQALQTAEALDNNGHRGITLNTLGNLCHDLFDGGDRKDRSLLNKAIAYFEDALECFGKASTTTSQSLVVMLNLGNCLILKKSVKKGFSMLQRALKGSETLGHKRFLARAYNNLGKGYFETGDFDSSKSHLHKSEVISVSENYSDIRFGNQFYLWQMAKNEGNELVLRNTKKTLDYLLKKLEGGDVVELQKYRAALKKEASDAGL